MLYLVPLFTIAVLRAESDLFTPDNNNSFSAEFSQFSLRIVSLLTQVFEDMKMKKHEKGLLQLFDAN